MAARRSRSRTSTPRTSRTRDGASRSRWRAARSRSRRSSATRLSRAGPRRHDRSAGGEAAARHAAEPPAAEREAYSAWPAITIGAHRRRKRGRGARRSPRTLRVHGGGPEQQHRRARVLHHLRGHRCAGRSVRRLHHPKLRLRLRVLTASCPADLFVFAGARPYGVTGNTEESILQRSGRGAPSSTGPQPSPTIPQGHRKPLAGARTGTVAATPSIAWDRQPP
jgi:hypothetical protein